jgi:hypothetical protein
MACRMASAREMPRLRQMTASASSWSSGRSMIVRIQTTSYIIIMMAWLDLLTRDPGR